MALTAGAAFFSLLIASPILAQSSPPDAAPLPSFEVASVKRSSPGESDSFRILPNRFTVRDYLIKALLAIVYGKDLGEFGLSELRLNQIVGGPKWIYSDGFTYEGYDIDAKVDDSLAEKFGKDCGNLFDSGSCGYRHEMMLMLQSLLADRFKLKVRWETRQDPVYALVIAHDGPKFLHTTFALPPPPCPAEMYCFQHYTSMARMADWLWGGADFPVIDQTGLQGGYYINLQWPRNPSVAGTHIAPQFASKAAMFAALPQQLGLELEPTQGPEEFLVIDHIERPSEN